MSGEVSRAGGFSGGSTRRRQRATESAERERQRIRDAVKRVQPLPAGATILELVAAFNALRKALVD